MKKILVIDDETQMRDLIQTALRTRFDVAAASGGEDGIQMAAELQPDLVLCDVNMRGMDGYETLTLVRQNPLTPHTPFILMTGNGSDTGMRRGMDLGADDYLRKPFSVAQLQTAVEVRLAKQDCIMRRAEEKFRSLQQSLATSLPTQLLAPMDDLLSLTELIGKGYRQFEFEDVVAMARDAHRVGLRVRQQVENCLVFAELTLLSEDKTRPSAWRAPQVLHVLDIVEPIVTETARQHQRLPDLHLSMSYCQSRVPESSLRKVVQEALDNAFKFSRPWTPVHVQVFPKDGEIVLEVADRGLGITPEQIVQLDAFVRFEEKLATTKGCGLGLTIARRLIELNGGRLTIAPRQGGGTLARIILPGPSGSQVFTE